MHFRQGASVFNTVVRYESVHLGHEIWLRRN